MDSKKLNSRFHIADNQLVKTSNGQPIPSEEPVFVLRGRDHLALPLLRIYVELCKVDGCNEQFLYEMEEPLREFATFAADHPKTMKQPGITRGR